MAERRVGRKSLGVALALLLVAALAAPAQALISLGVSQNCDSDGHCVAGGAQAVNAGPSGVVDVQVIPTNAGAAVAVCTGSGNGASLLEISCSHGQVSQTMSFPGTAGAVPLQTTQARLERLPVCWEVTGYFPRILAVQHVVGTSGCSQLAI